VKEKTLKWLIGILAVSLVGLVSVQVYYLSEALDTKEQEFTKSVHNALVSTVYKLERYEQAGVLPKFQASQQVNNLWRTGDTSATQPFSYQVKSKIVFEDDKGNVIQRDAEGIIDEQGNFSSKASQDDALWYAQNWPENVLKQLESEFNKFYPRPIFERVDVHFVYKLLANELKNQGINTKFHLALISEGKKFVKEQGITSDKFLQSRHKMKLFPNDFYFHDDFLSVYFPRENSFVFGKLIGIVLLSMIFIISILFVFGRTIKTVIKQKKLAIIKNDFINNMTHEFKTPISTISLACEVLSDDSIPKTQDRQKHFVKVINDENKRLGLLVENVLQTAVLDKGNFRLKKQEASIHELIEQAIERMSVRFKENQGQILFLPEADNDEFYIDKVHITNCINNLLDNAIKYSEGHPEVEVVTKNIYHGIMIDVKDNGVGISKENQQKIFEKLYRVPTGNVHDVKGFGLGLSYVKSIIEKHGGTIKVKSNIGKGSTFSIFLPLDESRYEQFDKNE
jgi:two-component system phosphate regulon sensor histidine kinase PhoR